MPRDAHCVHSETLFAVAGSTLASLGGQCKAAVAETFKFISQVLFSQVLFSRTHFSRTHWPRFVSNLPWLTEATPTCAAQRLKNFLFQNFILQESVTKIRNGSPFCVCFCEFLIQACRVEGSGKKANKESERGVVERKISRAQLAD
jgi:hypothetical protein